MPYLIIPHSIESAVETELKTLITNLKTRELLLEPVDVVSQEQVDELKLANAIKKDGWTVKNEVALGKLTEKYCWLPMMALHHKPFDQARFRKIVNEIVENLTDPGAELIKLEKQERARRDQLKRTLKEIDADEMLTNLVNTAQAYIKLRTYRINIIRRFNFYHLPLLHEISSRLRLDNEDIAFLTYEEILKALKHPSIGNKLIPTIKKRKMGFANLTWKGRTKVVSGIEDVIYAMEQYNIVPKTTSMKKELKGNPACKGLVTGTVKIVRKLSDLHKIQNGDVLVAKMTTPDYMIAINKAVAIVTDEGGITCHAAIVSREFNIPCIVGTSNATQILSDGDFVEVDAYSGIVKVIESADLPQDIKEITGKTIYGGKIKGIVRIILDVSDFDKLQKGDIVVASQTTPEYLSLLYRSKGFIVDEESLFSHAVLYGKALKLPSIMGTLYARNVLEDGERIELDATHGTIRRPQV